MAKWLAILFGVLLLITNGAWLYGAIDLAVTEKYRQQEEYENEKVLKSYKIVAGHFLVGMHRTNVLEVVEKRFPDEEPYEKNGCLVAGWLLLPIGDDGRVMEGQCEF